MNTQSSAMNESSIPSQGTAPAAVSPLQVMYWSIRREIWENRAIYIGPLTAAAVFLFGFAINLAIMRHHLVGASPLGIMRHHLGASPLGPDQPHDLLASRYELAASLIMGTAFIVGIFYSLDALYGERRDRSILFWKSLPVSDLTTVLSKLAIPLVVLPLLSFAITLATQFIMLVLSSVMLLGSGANIAALWTEVSFFQVSLVLLYHILTVHGLYYAPIYGWLLMVSAWAPRAPFIWAFLPPFVICGVEKIAFNTSYFLALLRDRFEGPGGTMADNDHAKDFTTLIPHHFFSVPGLWIGLAIAAVFLFVAVRLRRYRGPI
ncbi:MAG: ABC transporter permease [Candidatus Sulfotelmatobacter sp.]